MDRRWKRLERDVARLVGGRRIPVTGDRDGVDVAGQLFVYQVKSRRTLPTWLWSWLQGIRTQATRDQVGVLVLHRPHDELREALVIVSLTDWVALHGEAGWPGEEA